MLIVNAIADLEQLHITKFPVLVQAEFGKFSREANDSQQLREAVTQGLDASVTNCIGIYSIPTSIGELLANLSADTGHHSSMRPRREHPNFDKIIAYGELAMRYILVKMAAGESHWEYFMMLRELTGVNPVPDDHRGRFDTITADWLAWARENGKLDQLAVDLLAKS